MKNKPANESLATKIIANFVRKTRAPRASYLRERETLKKKGGSQTNPPPPHPCTPSVRNMWTRASLACSALHGLSLLLLTMQAVATKVDQGNPVLARGIQADTKPRIGQLLLHLLQSGRLPTLGVYPSRPVGAPPQGQECLLLAGCWQHVHRQQSNQATTGWVGCVWRER